MSFFAMIMGVFAAGAILWDGHAENAQVYATLAVAYALVYIGSRIGAK